MTLSRYLAARTRAVSALSGSSSQPGEEGALLDRAAQALTASVAAEDDGPSALAIRAYAEGLRCLAELERWESDTLSAAPDAERHLRAARLRSTRAAQMLPHPDPLGDPVREALIDIGDIEDPDAHRALRDGLLRVPLPVPLIEPRRAVSAPRSARTNESAPTEPRAAVIVVIADSPVTYSQGVTAGQVHDVEVEARILDWPEQFQRLVVRFLTRWPKSAIEVTDVVIERPSEATAGVWTGMGSGHLVLHAGAADPLTAITLAVDAELTGDSDTRPIAVLGQGELTLRVVDPASDVLTGAPVVDTRVLEMLAELREARIAPPEQPALGRFFGAIARAGVRILAEREFPPGSNPVETDFQRELLKRVAMAPELEGRVQKHAWQGGGPTDLIYDGVVAELKIEKETPVTLESAKSYLSQATQYASGGQRQLSVLAILDMTPMDAPPGVLANTMGWLEPRLHGLEDPAFPSRVAVIIIKGNLPLPSDWSR